jgi:hypothetical protein
LAYGDPSRESETDPRRAASHPLAGLDTKNLAGLEIGALCRPFIGREEGQPVIYVDHADTPTLRKKYANDSSVTVDRIVDVDAVLGRTRCGKQRGGGWWTMPLRRTSSSTFPI